jgi:hypothetical protein
VKFYVKFLYKSNGKLYLVSAKKSEFQYSEKSLLFGDENILVFKNFKYLSLEGLRIVENDTNTPIFNTLKSIESNMKPFLKKQDTLIILQNKKFEEITIKHKDNCIYPTPKCKILRIVMMTNSKNSVFKSLGNFIDLIPKKCKVHLTIKMKEDISKLCIEVANSIFEKWTVSKFTINTIYSQTSFYNLVALGLKAANYWKNLNTLEEIGYLGNFISRKVSSNKNEMLKHMNVLIQNSPSNYRIGSYQKKDEIEILNKDLIDISE